jgi:hypothetical protein
VCYVSSGVRPGISLPRTTERSARECGDECSEVPRRAAPQNHETSPWYRVYRTAAWYKCFFWVSCEEIFTTKNAKGAKVKLKTSNHGVRTVGYGIERTGVPAEDEGLMDFIGQAIEKSQTCAETNQVGARGRAGQGVNHEKAQGSIHEHVKHLVRLRELIRRGQHLDLGIDGETIGFNLVIGQPELGREVHAGSDDGVRIDFLHQPLKQAVFRTGTGDDANVSHLLFFFIVCLNFKTAKFNSIDVSVSLVCKSSSKISAISSPLFCMSDF